MLLQLVFLLVLLVKGTGYATLIEGIVVAEDGPIADSAVSVYENLSAFENDTPLAVSKAGKKPGMFIIELPPGKYYFVAKGRRDSRNFFSFHGSNPLSISSSDIWLPFAAVPASMTSVSPSTETKIKGTVTYKGSPVSEAVVTLYDIKGTTLKGMGILSRETDAAGRFSLHAPPGPYFVVARKRMDGKALKPLEKSDLYCFAPDNPVNIQQNREVEIEIGCYPKNDIESFVGESYAVKKNKVESLRLRNKEAEDTIDAPYSVSGRITDTGGTVLSGIHVVAYPVQDGEMFQMQEIRQQTTIMTTTDSTGRYHLSLPAAGKYYLIARESPGDSPMKGEFYGLYEGTPDHSVNITAKNVEADFTAVRVMDNAPLKTGHLSVEAVSKKTKGAKKITSSRKYADTVITEDTVWSGRIDISGRVVVGKGVRLTILPGAHIRFSRLDRDNDGVGDGELRVLGELRAEGTRERPIEFTSAEKIPKAGDWSYVLLFASGRPSTISYCNFRHAYTGVQVHFARAEITNCSFKGNIEGLRFGRADLVIRHNEIAGNDLGIRHHRLEGDIHISFNDIHGNGIGIFFVPSNQNKINFSVEEYLVDSELKQLPVIVNNNIHNNYRYNYSLGERAKHDVSLPGNWWGTGDIERIAAKIFDGNSDKELGTVNVIPFLEKRVTPAGIQRRSP